MSEITEIDISNFDTIIAADAKTNSNEIKKNGMFLNCTKLEKIVFENKCTFQHLTNFEEIFKGCEALKTLDLYSFDTSRATNMADMFNGCKSIISINFGNFKTSNVTNMDSMFNNCSSIEVLDLTSFDTSNVTSLNNMFCQESSSAKLKTIYAQDSFVCGNSCTYANIFDNCTHLVGGYGTAYSSIMGNYKPYICIDEGPTKPGLLTRK